MPVCDHGGFESRELFAIGQKNLCVLCYPKMPRSGHCETTCPACGATVTIHALQRSRKVDNG